MAKEELLEKQDLTKVPTVNSLKKEDYLLSVSENSVNKVFNSFFSDFKNNSRDFNNDFNLAVKSGYYRINGEEENSPGGNGILLVFKIADSLIYQIFFPQKGNSNIMLRRFTSEWEDWIITNPVLRLGKNNRFQVSYNEGISYSDITSEPIITQLRVYNNKILKSLDLGKTWEAISDNIAAWFRWKDNRIQISRDSQLTWENLSDEFLDNLRIQDYVETVDKLPTNASLGSIYMVGPDSKGKYRLHVNSSTGWIDNGEFAGLSVGVVQRLGQSITEVPSQKLLSDELENIYNSVQVITEEEYNKLEIKNPNIFYFTYEED